MSERLYSLLPAIHRVRDSAEGEPLRTLLGVIDGELERIEADIRGLYDNWFIETCDEWVVPYIGDLLGVRPLHAIDSAGVSVRAYVANTLAYRRRKGTAIVLEQLASDTTGWPARAVEFFSRLATTQHVNHVRHAPAATPDLRRAAAVELTDTAFDGFGHTAEVRRIASGRGRYNISNVGLFVWRLQTYRVGRVDSRGRPADLATARRVDEPGKPLYYSFHPVRDAPLFNQPQTETTIMHLAEEQNVPGKLRGPLLRAELDGLRRSEKWPEVFFSKDVPVLRVWVENAAGESPLEVDRGDIYICDFPADLAPASPERRTVAVDPLRGRLTFAPALAPEQRAFVSYSYGFSGDVGGGPYDRTASVVAANGEAQSEHGSEKGGFFDPGVWQCGVSHLFAASDSQHLVPTLRDAIAAWNAQPAGTTGVIVLTDSVSEHVFGDGPGAPLEILIPDGSRLLVVAGDWPLEEDPGTDPPVHKRRQGRFRADGVRPHLIGDLAVRSVTTSPTDDPANPGSCFLNGLLIEGSIVVEDGALGLLHVAHSTVVPHAGGIFVPSGNPRLRLHLTRSICGAIAVNEPIQRVELADSIVDPTIGSPGLALAAELSEALVERSSLFGSVRVQSITASDCIFRDHVHATRRQTGCMRFCYLPPGSFVPRRYRCQPELAVAAELSEARELAAEMAGEPALIDEAALRQKVHRRIKPSFISENYGDPEYGQLKRSCPVEIRGGAESGSEMGVFCFLEQPQREENLGRAVGEYLRFGLEAGIIFVT